MYGTESVPHKEIQSINNIDIQYRKSQVYPDKDNSNGMKEEGRARKEAQLVKNLLCMKIRIQIVNTHTKSHVWPWVTGNRRTTGDC